MNTAKSQSISLRPAQAEDEAVLAQLVYYASEGMALYLWEKMAVEGESGWDIGKQRAARETGSFSYRNAMIVEHDGAAAGTLIGYEIPEAPEPVPPETPAIFVPLQELENLAPGTWYLNILAVLPQFRNFGLGSRLLALADETGMRLGKSGMSVVVADNNVGAQRLYRRCYYAEAARLPMVTEDWITDGQEWVLLTKQI